MYEGSPARLVLGGVLIAALAAGLAWTLWGMRADSRAAPATSPSATPTTPPSASPSASPSPSSAPVGPATGDYAELATSAELEHPDTDPHIARWYRRFGPIDGNPWSNRGQLWDDLVNGLRQEAGELGAPFEHPLFHGDTPQPALVTVIWGDATTEGRGDVALIKATQRRDGRVTTRVWAALLEATDDGSGRVTARMDPFDLFVTDYRSFDDYQEAGDDRIWDWVSVQRNTDE